MGLGKTAQVLACMSQNLPNEGPEVRKTLVVLPKRLLPNWFREVRRHCSNTEFKMTPAHIYVPGSAREAWEDRNIM